MTNLYSDLWQNARALVILKIIFDLGRPAQLRELAAITAGDDETISKYCSFLAEQGLLTRVSSHAGWTLTDAGKLLLSPKLSTGAVDNFPQIPVNSPESPLSYLLKQSTHREVSKKESANSDFYSENTDLFQEIGIVLNFKTRQLANLHPPGVIRAEWQKLKDKGKPYPGLLIHALSSLPTPQSREDTDRKARQRYAEIPPRR